MTAEPRARAGRDADPIPLARLLSMAVTVVIDELHRELARRGHPNVRPAHGYALNAVLNGSVTASAIAPILGMTKQGAARLVQHLVDEGYLVYAEEARGDLRLKPLTLTPRGTALVGLSVEIQHAIERDWASVAGDAQIATTRRALEDAITRGGRVGLPPVRHGW